MGAQNHFERVRALVSRQTSVPESEITPETRLVEDLGVDGDDGDELLESFADEFRVDMEGMAPLNYFGDEPPIWGLSSFVPIIAAFNPRFREYAKRAMRGRRTLTVRNLVASARAQRWITPTTRPDDADPTRGGAALLASAIVAVAIAIYFGGPAVIVILLFIIAFMALNLWHSLGLLRRLDAAADYEESRGSSAED